MNPRYLLDTNALSEPARLRPHPAFMRRLHAHPEKCAIASTTWHEALFGVCRMPAGKRRDELEEYLLASVAPATPILPYDAAAADWHARERVRHAARGIAVSITDGQIAAVARVNDLIIVTRDTRGFSHFSDVEVENWWS